MIHCIVFKRSPYENEHMVNFLFQPNPIDTIEFKPIEYRDSSRNNNKNSWWRIHYDFQLNNSESIIVGTAREEVLARIQRGFEYQYNTYGRIKREC